MLLRKLGRLKLQSAVRPFSFNSAQKIDSEDELIKRLCDEIRAQSYPLANLDPLELCKNSDLYKINEKERLLSSLSLDQPIRIGAHNVNDSQSLISKLKSIYQDHVAYDFGYLPPDEREWLISQIEEMHDIKASHAKQKRIAQLLIESEAWDSFMERKFGQVKRYGLEGSESMLVALDTMFQLAAPTKHAVIAMAHRGRLNLMIGLFGYPAEAIFHKLQGNSELPDDGTADVLSHLSHQGPIRLGGQEGLVTLLPNSSHLESVNPIAQGFAYGLLSSLKATELLPIQIHGDAAFNGQGVTMETLQMANLEGFSVEGTIHITVNNQLGFTTPSYRGRSCQNSADLAKILKSPVFRVNANQPEDVARCAALAFSYRQKFGKDAFIDLIGYRKNGHNELDEPAFTQPLMYKSVKSLPSVAWLYRNQLLESGSISNETLVDIENHAVEKLDQALNNAATYEPKDSGIQQKTLDTIRSETKEEILKSSLLASIDVPKDFNLHSRLAKFHVESRKAMLKTDQYDWATAEAMAIGFLLNSGVSVRFCGQDVGRGTFSHRHWQLYDQKTGEVMTPLRTMESNGSKLEIVNSHLSEFAVSAFEYGASLQNPNKLLPIWEAQFGDFFNGAQIIWDAYLSSGEQKWALQSGLVVLLPHGYDGAGPEHSSARIERWLQMCDEPISGGTHQSVNMQVVNPTTPANYFHLLGRQMSRNFRKPLIVASAKTLLRLPVAVSKMKDFVESGFESVIDDEGCKTSAEKIKTVVLASGKFYYELVKERSNRSLDEKIALIRVEELCPFPKQKIQEILGKYKNTSRYVWCQEEPQNMGAYSWILPRLQTMRKDWEFIGRPASAAPAVGYSKLHKKQLETIFVQLFK